MKKITNKFSQFTTRDKIKERVLYLASSPYTGCSVFESKDAEQLKKQNGFDNLTVIVCKYQTDCFLLEYTKWFMQGFELAQKMGLPGCEHHNTLIQGTGVKVQTIDFGSFNFYGKDAYEIMNAYEESRDIQSYIINNHQIKQI